MVNINFIGTVFGDSGYSQHGRELAKALIRQGANLHIETTLVQGWEVLCSDEIFKAIKRPRFSISENPITIFIGLPHQYALAAAIPHNGFYPYLVWEGDKIPKHFLKYLSLANKILVPSNHVKQAILNTVHGYRAEHIVVIPHGVDTQLFTPQPQPEKFTFVANKGWAQGINDRGGVQFLLKAFTDEFNADENVQLNLKINIAYCPNGWDLNAELEKLNLRKERAPMNISVDSLPYEKMPKLYQGHCFVSPTMAEAFSIPCAEALACGLPVITTGYGGQTDFINHANGWLISYQMQEVKHDYMYEGINWAVPDYMELRKAMREAFNEKNGQTKMKSLNARASMNNMKLTWDESARKILALF